MFYNKTIIHEKFFNLILLSSRKTEHFIFFEEKIYFITHLNYNICASLQARSKKKKKNPQKTKKTLIHRKYQNSFSSSSSYPNQTVNIEPRGSLSEKESLKVYQLPSHFIQLNLTDYHFHMIDAGAFSSLYFSLLYFLVCNYFLKYF